MNPPNPASQHDAPAKQSGPVADARARGAANWDDEEPPVHRLSAAEAERFRDQRRSPSPWRVVLMQVEVGAVISLLFAVGFQLPGLWSALYGAATAVLPGALMARGATRMADSRSPMATAAALLAWESAKLVCSIAMLAAATKFLHPVVWPALLVTLTGCLTVYWAALARRPR